jgi:hypothetical protein
MCVYKYRHFKFLSWIINKFFDLGVWDPSLGSNGSFLQENFLNTELCDSSDVWWHQAK